MITARETANYLVAIAHDKGEVVTHLQLQKLCYYAQGFSLATRDRPLFSESIEAWKYGPVVPTLWHDFKKHGNDIIPPSPGFAKSSVPAEDRRLMLEVYGVYGQFSAWRLAELTHEEPPWRDTRRPDVNVVISHEAMSRYFKTQLV